ncbi:hypothetical protein [Anaerostipes faecalis]|nr:hypothetical protein [Anaerostipes faecalis]
MFYLEGAKEMLLVDDVDNRDFLESLLTKMYAIYSTRYYKLDAPIRGEEG